MLMSAEQSDALRILREAGEYWTVNWRLVKFINDPDNGLKKKEKGSEGLEESIILAYLASKQRYWADKGKLTPDGFFYNSVKSMKDDTTIDVRKQRKAIHNLEKMGLIEMKPLREKGVETKRYFRIHTKQLARCLGIEET